MEKLCSKQEWTLILTAASDRLTVQILFYTFYSHIDHCSMSDDLWWFLCQLRFFLPFSLSNRPSFASILDVVVDRCLLQSVLIHFIASIAPVLLEAKTLIHFNILLPYCLLSTSRWFCRITSTIIIRQIASDRCASEATSLPITATHCLHHSTSYHSRPLCIPFFGCLFLKP